MYIFLILEESKIIDKTLRVLLVNHSPPSPTAWDSVERHALCCLYQQLPLQSPHWGPGLLLGPWRPGGSTHWASCQGWRVSEPVQPAEHLFWHHCSQRVIHLFTHSVTDSPIHSFIHSSVIYWVLTWTKVLGAGHATRQKQTWVCLWKGVSQAKKISHKQIESYSRDTCWGGRPPRCDEIVRG